MTLRVRSCSTTGSRSSTVCGRASPSTYDGTRLHVDGVRFLPRPLQAPRIPIWSAVAVAAATEPGASRGAVRRRRAVPARRADDARATFASSATPSRRSARRTTSFDVCLHGPRELAADFADAGVTWFMESCYPEQPLAEVRRIIDRGPPRP